MHLLDRVVVSFLQPLDVEYHPTYDHHPITLASYSVWSPAN